MKRKLVLIALAVVLSATGASRVFAAATPTLNQTINAGTLATDILDASRASVASPSATLTAKSFAFDCYSGGGASTGTLGTDSERIYVINPDAADNGWTLTIAATGGATTTWASGGNNFDFNDGGGSGCTDGVDADSSGGQLTINANAGTLTADCASCATTNVTKGSSTAFVQGTTDSVTLLTAAAGSDDIWRGYLTGVALSQTIPAEQATGAYTLGMTITVTAS